MSEHKTELHAAIMNLPAGVPPVPDADNLPGSAEVLWAQGYKAGHRDARHAAAKLVCAAIPQAVSAEPQWLPIESAPKDGSQFLIWTRRLGFAVVVHDAYDPMPTNIVPSGHRLTVDDGKFGPYPIRGDYPTHWMPLPPAPKEQP